ncbi:MAG: response regulator, partial [Pseudomonadota bacterium]
NTLSILIVDSNRFNRNLLSDIARVTGIINVASASNEDTALWMLNEKIYDLVIGDWSPVNDINMPAFVRKMRKLPESRARRLPFIAAISDCTKETIIAGRDAGMDEFLAKPLSPAALEVRLKMVITTPRPFVDSKVYVGPCRRRKNPADYYGPKRRGADDINDFKSMGDGPVTLDQSNPLSVALHRVNIACKLLKAKGEDALPAFEQAIAQAQRLAADNADQPVEQALKAFEAYMVSATQARAADDTIVQTALATLAQLIVLPLEMAAPRKTVAGALSVAIKRKLAA